jgi:hypothetical protein
VCVVAVYSVKNLLIFHEIYILLVFQRLGLIRVDISLTGQKTKLWLIDELHRKFNISIQGLNTNFILCRKNGRTQEGGCGPNVTMQERQILFISTHNLS